MKCGLKTELNSKPDLGTAASSAPQGSILLCTIFRSGWDYGAQCTRRKFADGTDLGAVTDVPDSHLLSRGTSTGEMSGQEPPEA